METIPWYQSAIIRQSIVQMIISGLSLFGIASASIDVEGMIGSVFAGAAGLVAIWTVITRLRSAQRPITQEAVEKTQALARKQGGSTRASFMAALCVVGVTFGMIGPLASLHGCTGTVAAYRQAQKNPAELAYVLAEHYAALVGQAADLREKPGTPPAAIAAMQAADRAARPVIEQLKPLRDTYLAVQSASNEAQLQAALDRAVLSIADLVRTINVARGK